MSSTERTFDISSEIDGGTAVVRMSGSADFTRAGVIDDEMNKVTKSEPKELVYDLGGLTLIASLAIGALVACASTVRKRGGKVRTINVGEDVAEVLTIARLEEILGMEPTAGE